MSEISIIPMRRDNYAYLWHRAGRAVVVDPSDAEPVESLLEKHQLQLDAVLCTHHHQDHVGGVPRLWERFGMAVYGYRGEAERIPHLSHPLDDGEVFDVIGSSITAWHVPGHTRGALAFYLPEQRAVFTGDTMFSAGCGRLFEGTPAQMLASIQHIARLPDETRVYAGHEYTASNLRFALHVEPDNQAAADHLKKVTTAIPSMPSTIGLEKQINPFLRGHSATIRHHIAMLEADELEVFTMLRQMKDTF